MARIQFMSVFIPQCLKEESCPLHTNILKMKWRLIKKLRKESSLSSSSSHLLSPVRPVSMTGQTGPGLSSRTGPSTTRLLDMTSPHFQSRNCSRCLLAFVRISEMLWLASGSKGGIARGSGTIKRGHMQH